MSEPTRSQIKKAVDEGNKEILKRLEELENKISEEQAKEQQEVQHIKLAAYIKGQLGFGA